MTGILRRIEDLLHNVAPSWTTLHVVPRGTPRFLDANLRGVIRYASRVGSFLPNIQPENRVTLVETAQARSQTIRVDRIVDGMRPGSLVIVDEREVQMILDVMEDDRSLTTLNLLKGAHAAGVNVDLFAEAYRVVGPVEALRKASITVTQGASSLVFQAQSGGPRGNAITVEAVAPTTPNTAFSLTVEQLKVTIYLGSDGSGVINTPLSQMVAALNTTVSTPVVVSVTGSDSTIASAFSRRSLTGGAEATQVTVRGRFPVLTGDQLWIQSDPELLLSGTNYDVVDAVAVSMSGTLYNTVCTLKQGIPRDLAIDDVVFLRANPGYRSPVVNIPAHRRLPLPLGPFVVDYVSGRWTEGSDPKETLDLQTFDVLGPCAPYAAATAVPKNTPIINVGIHQSAFLLFKNLRGVVTYRDGKVVLRADDRGRCFIWADLVPAWPAGVRWRTVVNFLSSTSCAFGYRFVPNDMRYESGLGGEQRVITIDFSGENATRLELSLSGPPGCEIEMFDWQVDGPSVEQLQYSVAAQVVGETVWQAGSLQIKPYFQSIADLHMQLDVDSFDNGKLLL